MKRVINFLRIIIVSPEMAFIAVLCLSVYLYPVFFIWVASEVNAVEDVIKYLAFVPLALGGMIVRQKDELLFPTHKSNNTLQEWPDYNSLLLDTYWGCLFFEAVSVVSTLGVWIFNADIKNYIVFSVFVGGIVVSIISYLTFFNSTITIKRIFDLNFIFALC